MLSEHLVLGEELFPNCCSKRNKKERVHHDPLILKVSHQLKCLSQIKDGRRAVINEDGSSKGLTAGFVKKIWKPFHYKPGCLDEKDNIQIENLVETKPGDRDFLILLGYKLRNEHPRIEDSWLEYP